VMLAVVVIDQMTCGLMQRWSTNVRFEDAAAPGVQARLANLAEPISPRPEAEVVRVDPVQTPQPEPRPEQALVQPPTVSDRKKLEDLFRDG
jgi:hypothetical protein